MTDIVEETVVFITWARHLFRRRWGRRVLRDLESSHWQFEIRTYAFFTLRVRNINGFVIFSSLFTSLNIDIVMTSQTNSPRMHRSSGRDQGNSRYTKIRFSGQWYAWSELSDLERLRLIPASSWKKNFFPVSRTQFRIQRVFLEDSLIHVSGEHEGVHVSVLMLAQSRYEDR